MPSTKLAYWDIRGLAEPLRYILKYVGEEFEDIRYKVGDAPEYNRDDWFNVKFTLGLPFPNLPYYIDDEVQITNTNAIFKYLGRKYKLDGDTAKEKVDCDVGLEVVMDLRNGFVGICYSNAEKFKENRETYVKNATAKIAALDKFLGDKSFMAGSKLTVCDFHLYEMLDQHLVFEPSILNDFPKLTEYHQRFQELPGIKEYLKTGKVKATPLNNKMASFK